MAQAMKKEVRKLTPRMQKFREAIQSYNVTISFVKGAHNLIGDALSRSPLRGAEQVEAVLRRLRGHASYAYNNIVSYINGDICKEVIKDPALDDMWEAARLDEGYMSVARTIKQKTGGDVYKTLSNAAIQEYVGKGIERMSVMEKGESMIMLKDQTRIVVPETMRKRLMDREHLAHPGQSKMLASMRAKYFWPGIEKDVRRVVESCEPCQLHMNSQVRDPHRLSLEYVSRPMQAIGIDFFQRGGHKYLLMMDHFSGMPINEKMGISTDNEHTVRQLKRWFATFGVSRSIRCDNGPPLSSMGFKEFCDEYGIQLNLTSP